TPHTLPEKIDTDIERVLRRRCSRPGAASVARFLPGTHDLQFTRLVVGVDVENPFVGLALLREFEWPADTVVVDVLTAVEQLLALGERRAFLAVPCDPVD